MVRIVFRLVQTHAVKLDSRRPYIQGDHITTRATQNIWPNIPNEKQCLDESSNLYTIWPTVYMQFCQMIISYYVCKTDYSHRKYFSIIFLFCNAFLAEQTQRFPWDISMKNKYSHETQIYSWNIYMKHKYFHENTNISMRHFHETKNLSVKYNIICFEAKIPNRENPRLYFIMWIPKNLITHYCEEGIWSTALSTFICQPLQSRFQWFPDWLFI